MANNNSERIDDLVAPEALKQLTDLDSALEKSYQNMEKLLKPTQEVEKALSKAAMTYKDLIDTIGKYEATNRRSNASLSETERLQRRIQQLQEKIAGGFSQEALEVERLTQVMNQITRTRRNLIQAEQSQSGSLVQLRGNLNLLIQSYDAMNEKTRNSPLGQSMLQDIQELNNQLLQLEATTGRNQRNIGNYASGWNGLNVSIQQIAREMPAMAVSMNTFFLAISNNIPMLVDEINRLRAVNLQLAADGQQTISIGKQILKSIFSWNMLITVSVTLLTLFGGKLINWIKGLFDAEGAIRVTIKAQKDLNDALSEGSKNAIKDLTRLRLLYGVTQDLTRSVQERKTAVDELQKQYPAYFKNLSDESIMAGNASEQYRNLAENIIKAARARAMEDKIIENEKEMLRLEERRDSLQDRYSNKITELLNTQTEAEEKLKDAYNAPVMRTERIKEAQWAVDEAKKNVKEFDDLMKSTAKDYDVKIFLTSESNKNLASRINPEDLLGTKIETKSDATPKNNNKDLEKRIESERKAIQDLEEFRIKTVTDSNKRLSDDDKQTYENRLGYLDDYVSSAKEGIDEQAKNQISNLKKSEMTEKAYTASVTLINEKASEERIKIDQESAKIRESIQKDYAERIIKQVQDRIINEAQIIERAENAEMQNLASAYKRGELTSKQYEDKRLELTRRSSIDRMDAEIGSLDELLNRTDITEDQKLQISKQLADARLDYEKYVNEAIISDEEKAAEKRLQIEQQLSDKRKELLQASMDLIGTLFSAQTESQLAALDKQSEANDDYFSEQEDKIERLADAGAISDEQAEARKAALAEQQKAREADLEEQKKEINQRQAKYEKAMSIARISMDTASAIMRLWVNPGFPAAIPLAITTAALGAAQIATVLATPIPEYAKGTDDHKGGPAIVGDGGRSELVITPDNKMYKTPSRSTLVDLPAGSQVMPDFNKAILAMSMQQLITPILDNKTIVIAENERQIELAAQNNKLLSNMGGQIVKAIRNTNRNNSLIRY